jgi:hypothetical protein
LGSEGGVLVAAFVLLRWEWRKYKAGGKERIEGLVVSRLDWDLAYIKSDCIVGREGDGREEKRREEKEKRVCTLYKLVDCHVTQKRGILHLQS